MLQICLRNSFKEDTSTLSFKFNCDVKKSDEAFSYFLYYYFAEAVKVFYSMLNQNRGLLTTCGEFYSI